MFASHHWPRWGNGRIQEVLRAQRDLYAHMNNQVLHLANQGVTINEIHNEYEVPKGLQNKWYCRGYHGSPQHNSRGVIQRYLGFWDCNPTTLVPLSPRDSAPLYVEMMGGAKNIMARGQQLHDEGRYLLASEIVNKLVQAQPQNQAAKDLLADIFEQIGYQQENPGLRNSFLAGAYELRTGIPQPRFRQEYPMTDECISLLRQRMIEDMSLRNFGEKTQKDYIRAVKNLTIFLQRSPDTASNEDVRLFQLHLTANRVGASTINGTVTALRFFFTVTLDRTDVIKHLKFVPEPRKIPAILSPEEVARFLKAAPGVKYKAAFSVAYGAGLRVSEVAALKVSDIQYAGRRRRRAYCRSCRAGYRNSRRHRA